MKYYYIYRITNLVNGKTYIGQHRYKNLNDNYMGSGVALKSSIKKYGIENFKKELIYTRIKLQETADTLEILTIEKEKANGKAEYNLIAGGHGYRPTLCKAKSSAWKSRMSEVMKGKQFSSEHKKHLSESKIGNTNAKGSIRSDGYRKKQSESHKGQVHSLEQNAKVSETCKRKMAETKKAYYDYKIKNPSITWNGFQKIRKSGAL